jgi:hypothetical protein
VSLTNEPSSVTVLGRRGPVASPASARGASSMLDESRDEPISLRRAATSKSLSLTLSFSFLRFSLSFEFRLSLDGGRGRGCGAMSESDD